MKLSFSPVERLFFPKINLSEKVEKSPMVGYIKIFESQQKLILLYFSFFLLCLTFSIFSCVFFLGMTWKYGSEAENLKILLISFLLMSFTLFLHSFWVFLKFKRKNKLAFLEICRCLEKDYDKYLSILENSREIGRKKALLAENEITEETGIFFLECFSCGNRFDLRFTESRCPHCDAEIPATAFN